MKNKSMRNLFAATAAGAALAGAWSPPAAACDGSTPFLAGVCIFAGNFAPRGWAFTNGQLLPINQNQALFALIGTIYGGNGQTTFALPDTRGRVVIGFGQGPGLSNYQLGQRGGTEGVTLSVNQMPSHTHTASTTVNATATAKGQSATGNADAPGGNTWAARPRGAQYSSTAPDVDLQAGTIDVGATATTTVGNAGGSQPVSIVQPYETLNYIIALQGIFPPRD